jgi:hypothetical protein
VSLRELRRLQQKAKQAETFSPGYISLTAQAYESMVRTFRLPFRAIEGSSVVGPFFWSSLDQDEEDPHLRMLRPSSYNLGNGITELRFVQNSSSASPTSVRRARHAAGS